jgi:hypothetical protein
MKQTQDPIVLTGYTFVTGALADIFQSRELKPKHAKTGDMKLWCQRGERVWTGQFRAAVFDGREWRTFRLNIVASSDARYDSFDNRTDKVKLCFAAIRQLKDQTARLREGSYGCTFTMKAGTSNAATASSTPPVEAKPATASATTPPATQPTAAAARTAQTPPLGTGTKVQVSGRKRKRKGDNPDQLTLF